MSRKFSPLIILAALAIAFGCGSLDPDYSDEPILKPLKTKITISQSEATQISNYVRQGLTDLANGQQPAGLPGPKPFWGPTRVFLSVFIDGQEPLLSNSDLAGIDDCLTQAMLNLTAQPELAANFLPYINDLRLRIDFQRWQKKINAPTEKDALPSVEDGWDGLILQKPNELVIMPPFDIRFNGWDVPDGPKRLTRRLERTFDRLTRQAGLNAKSWNKANLYRFRTDAFLQTKAGVKAEKLYRGNILLPRPISKENVEEALIAAADWLVDNLNEKGKFTYLYDPVKDKVNHPLHYGVVRHAGAVYSLYAVYNATGDERYLTAAERSLGYLKTVSSPPLFEPDLLSIRQNRLSLLGASALGLLALCEKPADLRTTEDNRMMRQLADFLLRMQLDDGAFYTFYLQALVDYRPKVQALYFPGESLLALVRYSEELRRAGQDYSRYLKAADKSAAFQITEFEKTKMPDNWTIQALSRLHAFTAEDRLATACLAMARHQVNQQYGGGEKSKYRDYYGGFANSRPPRTTPAASRTEAIAAAWDLAHRLDHPDQYLLAGSVRRAAWFISCNQFRSENAYYLKNPKRALGGIRGGLVDNNIRVDYNQHSIIALLGALRVIDYLTEKSEEAPPDLPFTDQKSTL